MTYQPGERLQITTTGTVGRIIEAADRTWLELLLDPEGGVAQSIPLDCPAVTITRVTPTIADILRDGAALVENGEAAGAVNGILLAAETPYAADVAMRTLARHLHYPATEEPLPHLIRWSALETDERVVAAMRAAATAAEQGDL